MLRSLHDLKEAIENHEALAAAAGVTAVGIAALGAGKLKEICTKFGSKVSLAMA